MYLRRIIESILGPDNPIGFGDRVTFRHWCEEGAGATIDMSTGDYFCPVCGAGDLIHLYMGRFRCGLDVARDALLYAELNKCRLPMPEYVQSVLRGDVSKKHLFPYHRDVRMSTEFISRCHEDLLGDPVFQRVILEKLGIGPKAIESRQLGVMRWRGLRSRIKWWLVIPRIKNGEVKAIDLRNPFSLIRIRFLPSASGGVQYKKRLAKARGTRAPIEISQE